MTGKFLNKSVEVLVLEAEVRGLKAELQYYKQYDEKRRGHFSPILNASVETIAVADGRTTFQLAASAEAKFEYARGRVVFQMCGWENDARDLRVQTYVSTDALNTHICPQDLMIDAHEKMVLHLCKNYEKRWK